MEDYLRVAYIGLTEPETKVLKSMFSLVPQLKETYRIIKPDQIRHAHIILVNTEDATSMNIWQQVSEMNRQATALMLGNAQNPIEGAINLQKPLRMQKLVSALENIAKDRSLFFHPDNESGNESEIRALIVDDSYPVRKYMEGKLIELSETPIRLSFATSGEEAMNKFEPGNYDIVFLDVVMPGVDGYKVCKAMKNLKSTYIVMLTSKKSPFDKIRGTMSGCNAYITKPPLDSRLTEELNACIKMHDKRQPVTGTLKAHSS